MFLLQCEGRERPSPLDLKVAVYIPMEVSFNPGEIISHLRHRLVAWWGEVIPFSNMGAGMNQ